jgi:histone-lysine N-methyltransferase SETMAR
MRRVSAKFVPRLLSQEQKELRLSISFELLDRANSDSGFLRSLITGEESWVYGYEPETKMQSSHWKSNQSKSNVKVVLIVFFDIEGIVRAEFMPRGTTVNSEYYKGLLERLRNNENGRRSGRTDLCCIMTTLRVTCPLSSASFWLI